MINPDVFSSSNSFYFAPNFLFLLLYTSIASSKSFSLKSGQFLSTNKNSVYTNCQGKKLLKRISPLVLINRSGSG